MTNPHSEIVAAAPFTNEEAERVMRYVDAVKWRANLGKDLTGEYLGAALGEILAELRPARLQSLALSGAGEVVPRNFLTHRNSWHRAIEIAEAQAADNDDRSYWQHELRAYDEAHSELCTHPVAPGAGDALPCGHPASLMLTSAETGLPLYCELCDALGRARDGEAMEAEWRAKYEQLAAHPASPGAGEAGFIWPAGIQNHDDDKSHSTFVYGTAEHLHLDFAESRDRQLSFLIKADGTAQFVAYIDGESVKGDAEDSASLWATLRRLTASPSHTLGMDPPDAQPAAPAGGGESGRICQECGTTVDADGLPIAAARLPGGGEAASGRTACAYCGALEGGHTMACQSIHADGPKPAQIHVPPRAPTPPASAALSEGEVGALARVEVMQNEAVRPSTRDIDTICAALRRLGGAR